MLLQQWVLAPGRVTQLLTVGSRPWHGNAGTVVCSRPWQGNAVTAVGSRPWQGNAVTAVGSRPWQGNAVLQWALDPGRVTQYYSGLSTLAG